jgi:tRNA nucleotidyltransferase (CCA-adding enzyme)
VTPTRKEEAALRKTADKMLERLQASSKSYGEVRDIQLGGSFAKGTWLPHDVDLDIFIRIADSVGNSRFEQIGLAMGEDAVEGYPHGKKYAQHPYTEATVEGVKVNIVPCYDVKPGNWKSAADRSLYHVEFVKTKMSEKEKLQVRLLKRFMKSIGVYGAEIEKEGFSGYAAEVLTYSHRSFGEVLGSFAGLRLEEGESFSLKDPVDPGRELATAISGESVARMVLASRGFIDAPELAYFKKIRQRVRKSLIGRLYCVRFEHIPLSEDTLWGELKKSTRQLVRFIESQGFVVIRAAAISNDVDKSAIVLLPMFEELPEISERVGPSVYLAEEVKKFVEKNRDKAELIWVTDDARVRMLQKRRFMKLERLLDQICRQDIEKVGASRDIVLSIKRTGRVLSGHALLREHAKESWFAEGIDQIVSDSIGTNQD